MIFEKTIRDFSIFKSFKKKRFTDEFYKKIMTEKIDFKILHFYSSVIFFKNWLKSWPSVK